MKEEWIVFTDQHTGRELCAYTVRGTFPGELEATTFKMPIIGSLKNFPRRAGSHSRTSGT